MSAGYEPRVRLQLYLLRQPTKPSHGIIVQDYHTLDRTSSTIFYYSFSKWTIIKPNTGAPSVVGALRKTPSYTLRRLELRPLIPPSTTPEISHPRIKGGLPSKGKAPDRTASSTGFTLVARTLTRTSVGRGTGRGVSAHSRTSGPPNVFCVIAYIVEVS